MTLAAVQAAMQRHQKNLRTLFPGFVKIGSATYEASMTSGGISEQPAADGTGFRLVQTLNFSILKSLLATPPAIGAEITAEGKTWKIENISGHDAIDVSWQFTALRFPKSL